MRFVAHARWLVVALFVLGSLLRPGRADAVTELFVLDSINGSVLRYDADTGAFLSRFAQPVSDQAGATAMAFGFDGNLYVGSNNTVLRYDGTTGAFLGNFVAPGSGRLEGPERILFHGPEMLVTSFGWGGGTGGAVKRYDAATGAYLGDLVRPNQGIGNATGAEFGPDGTLYVASVNGPQQISRYDGTTGATLAPLPVPSHTIAWGLTLGPDGLLYAGMFNSTVHRYRTDVVGEPMPFASAPVLDVGFESLAFAPNGDLYVAAAGAIGNGGAVLRFDGATGAYRGPIVPVGRGGLQRPFNVAFRPAAIPEPGSLALLLVGALPLVRRRRR
jgi:hypothetical protein